MSSCNRALASQQINLLLIILPSRNIQDVDGFEVFFPHMYTQRHPDGNSPSVPREGRNLGKIPILRLSHGTHWHQASEIRPKGDHPDHYVFKPSVKVGKKFVSEDTERTFKYTDRFNSKFILVPSDSPLLPGKYSWWGVSVEDWYNSSDPDGQEFGRQVRELKRNRIFVAEYLQTDTPECQYGSYVFTISLKSLLHVYNRSRTDITDANERILKFRFAGTLRYRFEICYVIIVSMKHDDATLSEFTSVHEDKTVFDHNGLVNASGEIRDDSATPYIHLKHKIKCIPKKQYQSWETLTFAFYYPNDSSDKLECPKDSVTELRSVRHKCHKQCKTGLEMDDDDDYD